MHQAAAQRRLVVAALRVRATVPRTAIAPPAAASRCGVCARSCRSARAPPHVLPAAHHSCSRTVRSSKYMVLDRKSMPMVACAPPQASVTRRSAHCDERLRLARPPAPLPGGARLAALRRAWYVLSNLSYMKRVMMDVLPTLCPQQSASAPRAGTRFRAAPSASEHRDTCADARHDAVRRAALRTPRAAVAEAPSRRARRSASEGRHSPKRRERCGGSAPGRPRRRACTSPAARLPAPPWRRRRRRRQRCRTRSAAHARAR